MVKGYREIGRAGSIARVDVELDHDAIRAMIVLVVEENMLTGNQVQTVVTLEEEARRVRQRGIPVVGEDRGHTEQHRFDRHGGCIHGIGIYGNE